MSAFDRLNPDRKEYLIELGIDPMKVVETPIRCTAPDGRNKNCGIHIADGLQEAIGRLVRLDATEKGRVVPNDERTRTFPDQRWFDVHCLKHSAHVITIPGDAQTLYS